MYQSTLLQEENKNVQKRINEIASENLSINKELKELVSENEKTKNILLERENKIRITQENLEERQKELRKEEIFSEARKAELRKREQTLQDREGIVEAASLQAIEREHDAEMAERLAEDEKIKYENSFKELESQKEHIDLLEAEAISKMNEAIRKEEMASSIYEKAKIIDEEMKEKETAFEKNRLEIVSSLEEKIAEYERRIQDLEGVRNLIDDVKFDESADGKAAKIVVKEAIRQAKKVMTDFMLKFNELDEKYCDGTFKGFSTPLDQIDTNFSILKSQYEMIKDHMETHELPSSAKKWLENIEDCIIKADTCKKSWEFSEAFRYILFGLSACKNFELLLNILNEWGGETQEESSETVEDDFIDWYLIFEVNEHVTIDGLRKQYRLLVLKYHPDKNPDSEDECTEKMILINKAKEILFDELLRKEFDEKRKNYKH
jgi:DNA repair exonuclease SbcCD ATPase subunit